MHAAPSALVAEPVARLLLEVQGLKHLPRTGWVRAGVPDPETVGAHAWGVALLGLLLCPTTLDRGRVLAMAVLHDLAEVRVGDLTPHDGVEPSEKRARERVALADLLAPLPDAAALRDLQEEYEAGSTPEARFVRLLDRLDMGLQAVHAEARTADRMAGPVDLREFVASARVALAGSGWEALLT